VVGLQKLLSVIYYSSSYYAIEYTCQEGLHAGNNSDLTDELIIFADKSLPVVGGTILPICLDVL